MDRNAMFREGLSIVYSMGYGRKGKVGKERGGRGYLFQGEMGQRECKLEAEGRSAYLSERRDWAGVVS